jgi:hypothetical protein
MKLFKCVVVGVLSVSTTFLMLALLSTLRAHAGMVVVYEDHPIIKDQTITVLTYYNNDYFDGYHTIVYSTRDINSLFMHQVNMDAIDIVHSWAKCWITNKIIQEMHERHAELVARQQQRDLTPLINSYYRANSSSSSSSSSSRPRRIDPTIQLYDPELETSVSGDELSVIAEGSESSSDSE